MNSRSARLLGFAPLVGLDALRTALNAVAGPQVHACHGPGVIALLQQEPDAPLFGGGRKATAAMLLTVQRRLEMACQAGPFLPMDPPTACCPAEAVSHLLESAWSSLGSALIAQGGRHQWDVVLHWAREPVVTRHRATPAAAAGQDKAALTEAADSVLRAKRSQCEAALLTVLAPTVLAFASGGVACVETEIVVTLLVNAGAEATVKAALDALPAKHAENASIDMRGPLPPLSFSAVRLVTVEARDINRAWQLLDLSDRVDLASLHRQWRQRTASAHPDRRPAKGAVTVIELAEAYRLLRSLLLTDAAVRFQTLNSLLRHASPRLVVPDDPMAAPAGVLDAVREMAW